MKVYVLVETIRLLTLSVNFDNTDLCLKNVFDEIYVILNQLTITTLFCIIIIWLQSLSNFFMLTSEIRIID